MENEAEGMAGSTQRASGRRLRQYISNPSCIFDEYYFEYFLFLKNLIHFISGTIHVHHRTRRQDEIRKCS